MSHIMRYGRGDPVNPHSGETPLTPTPSAHLLLKTGMTSVDPRNLESKDVPKAYGGSALCAGEKIGVFATWLFIYGETP